jgi:hypothetical protein
MSLRLTFPLLVVLAGCQGFDPPRPETLARLRPMPIGGTLPARFEVEIASPVLSGIFDAVLAVDPRGLQLQLFPDIGGKMLDLQLRDLAVVADLPGHHYEARPPLDRASPHLALVLAAVFAELAAPVAPQRVLGERTSADGRAEVALRPALDSGEVVATLGADGAIERYVFRLGWLEFALTAAGELQGSGFAGWLRWPPPARVEGA